MFSRLFVSIAVILSPAYVSAEIVFLNDANTTVSLGPNMTAEPFANRTTVDSLASIIDLESANAGELHLQTTHVWVSGGQLELQFDFGSEYDLDTFHFWNYHGEFWDVDDIDLTFLDANRAVVGSVMDLAPALGNTTGLDSDPIFAEDFKLSVPGKVQFVDAVLSGSNGQVDFNNMAFTGSVTAIPEPSCVALLVVATTCCVMPRRRRSRNSLTTVGTEL